MSDMLSPAPEITKKSHTLAIVYSVLVAIIVFLLLISVYIYRDQLSRWYQQMAAKHAVQGAFVLQVNGPIRSIGKISGDTIVPVPLAIGEGKLIDFTEAAGVRVATVQEPVSWIDEKMVLLGATTTTLTMGNVDSGIALSADGKLLAYAEHRSMFPATTTAATLLPAILSSKPEDWEVYVRNLSTGKITDYGAGSGPSFFTTNGQQYILITTSSGARISSLSTHTGPSITVPTSNQFVQPVRISPDGNYIAAYDARAQSYQVYLLARSGNAAQTKPLLVSNLTGLVFIGDRVVGIQGTKGGGVVLASVNAKGTPIHTVLFSVGAAIIRLIP